MSISSALQSLVLVGAVFALSVPAADIAYRLGGARPSDDLAGLYQNFGDGSYRMREHVETSADWYSGAFTVYTDELGLRSASSSAVSRASDGHLDFLILGDSQGFGQGVSFEESLVGELDRLAMESAPSRTVGNASVGGHYLRNQLEVAQWMASGADVSFDRVVVLLTPYLISSARLYNQAVVSDDGKLWGQDPDLVSRALMWAKTNTALYGILRNAYWNARGAEPDPGVFSMFIDGRVDRDQVRTELDDVLGELTTWAEEESAEVAIVYLPFILEFDPQGAEAMAASVGSDLDLEVAAAMARTAAEELDLEFFDLRPAVAAVAATGEPLGLRGDPHYNRETSLAAAAALWDFLETLD